VAVRKGYYTPPRILIGAGTGTRPCTQPQKVTGRGWRLLAWPHRDRKRERRANPLLTLHPDPPAMELHKLTAEGEPQPGAFHLLARRPRLTELLEDLLLVLSGNADRRVADRYLN